MIELLEILKCFLLDQGRLANDRRPGRLLDSEIIIDFKILVGVVGGVSQGKKWHQ